MHRTFLTVAVVVLACAIGTVFGQTPQSNGIIRGSVSDQTKALIPGAEITLSNLEKPEVKRAISNARGEYAIEAPAGLYELRAEMPGFETSITSPIRLKENETLQADLITPFDGKWATEQPDNGGLGGDFLVIHDGKRMGNQIRFRTTVTVDSRTGRPLAAPAVTSWTADMADDNTLRLSWHLELVGTNVLDLLILPATVR